MIASENSLSRRAIRGFRMIGVLALVATPLTGWGVTAGAAPLPTGSGLVKADPLTSPGIDGHRGGATAPAGGQGSRGGTADDSCCGRGRPQVA